MLSLLNILFFIGHDLIIVINLFGWIFPSTRRVQRVTLGCTLFSWLVMGAWYGWGYCLCTDWHFQIRRRLGVHQNESSYTQLLLYQMTGQQFSRQFSDSLTLALMVLILVGTCLAWFWDRSRKRQVSQ